MKGCRIDEVAAVFFYLEEGPAWLDEPYMIEYDTFDEAREEFLRVANVVDTEEPWKEGGHRGDCTAYPATCLRCFVEEYREYARQWLDWFDNGEELWKVKMNSREGIGV